ncbi:MAG: hypothetical protein Q4C48_11320 [Lachnospiraceae bacterium]|nr:hypothetical protein [Lachnospiraceae bacterium]MDO4318774.1 hypothetical protein [Lachnospiraceae bacterium]
MRKKKRRRKKSIYDIGREKYNFDYQEEIIRYKALCCMHLERKEIKKLKFDKNISSYKDWKEYIRHKYEKFDKEDLMEFSRFLNCVGRDEVLEHNFSLLLIGGLVTLIFTKIFEALMETIDILLVGGSDFILLRIVLYILMVLLLYAIVAVTMYFFAMKPIRKKDTKENLISDYKEIIDEMALNKS